MVGLINTILLLYVLPAIIVYLSARVIYKYGGFLDDMGPLGLFLAMFVPYVNLFFVIIWGAIAISDYNDYRRSLSAYGFKEVLARLLRVKKIPKRRDW